MARNYRITVQYDPTDGSLQIEPERSRDLVLAANTSPIHSVCWTFEGVRGLVAAGWAPTIRFVLGPDKPIPAYSGPFLSLTRTAAAVIASGNTGQTGRFRYFAVLKPPIDSALSAISSSEASLHNQVTEPASTVVRVTAAADRQGLLRIEPEAVSYYAGQSIAWEVDEALDDVVEWYPRIVFENQPGTMNSHFGPFGSLDVRDRSILASGASGQPAGAYNYVFQMVSVEGEQVLFASTPDPTVDDEGEPPDDDEP